MDHLCGSGNLLQGVHSRGLLKSIDGGDSWELLTLGGADPSRGFARIFVDPTDPSGATIYACGGFGPGSEFRGIFKSVDGGTTWSSAQSGIPAGKGVGVADLDYIIQNGKITLLAGVTDAFSVQPAANGIWRSLDGSSSWSPMPFAPLRDLTGIPYAPSDIGTIRLATDRTPDAPRGAYAAVTRRPEQTPKQPDAILNVFKLTGDEWIPVRGRGLASDAPTSGALAFGLSEIGWLYLGMGADQDGTDRIFESRDRGANWSSIYSFSKGRPHHDQRCWGFGGGQVFEGNDGGIYRYRPSPGAGKGTWQSLNTSSLQTTLVQGIDLHPQYPNVILAGNQDNGVALRSRGTWKYVAGGDGGPVRFDQHRGRFA